jgi:hypothetical protein
LNSNENITDDNEERVIHDTARWSMQYFCGLCIY